jgi:peroxiredoxin
MKWRSLEESARGTDTRSLREIFAERKEKIAQYVPAETQAVQQRVIAGLRSHGRAANALGAGDKAPPFTLPDQNATPICSDDLLSRGRLVVCFSRGRWDPFCCGQLEAMNQIMPAIHEAGASLVAISPQIVKQCFFMVDQHRLRFPVLSDAGNAVAIAARSSIFPSPMATRVGSYRFQRPTFLIAMRRLCIDRQMKIPRSGLNPRKSWSTCDEGRRDRDPVPSDQRDHCEPVRARRCVAHRGTRFIDRDGSWASCWFDSKAHAAERLVTLHSNLWELSGVHSR